MLCHSHQMSCCFLSCRSHHMDALCHSHAMSCCFPFSRSHRVRWFCHSRQISCVYFLPQPSHEIRFPTATNKVCFFLPQPSTATRLATATKLCHLLAESTCVSFLLVLATTVERDALRHSSYTSCVSLYRSHRMRLQPPNKLLFSFLPQPS